MRCAEATGAYSGVLLLCLLFVGGGWWCVSSWMIWFVVVIRWQKCYAKQRAGETWWCHLFVWSELRQPRRGGKFLPP